MTEYKHWCSPMLSRVVPAKLLRFALYQSDDQEVIRNSFAINFSYGNREILLKYVGLDYSHQIIGILEHGVQEDWTDFDLLTPRLISGARSKYWAWSYDTELLAISRGFSHVKAIGAPWYYMKRNLVEKASFKEKQSNRILIMPSHSTGNAVDKATVSMKQARAKMFRDIVGNTPATVCLHAVDFCDVETYRAFQDFGFQITCIGNSWQQPIWSSAGSRVRMMFNLHELFLNHTHYLSDGYGTSLNYAIDMGLKIGIFPDIKKGQILGNDWSKSEEFFNNLYKLEKDYLHEKFPKLINNFGDSAEYLHFAEAKLGLDCVRDPDELLDLLDYRANVYPSELGVEPW